MTHSKDSPITGWSRRRVLAAGGAALSAGLAGCSGVVGSGSGDEGDSGPKAVASFFSFYDFARKVADGTPIEVENLVPAGLHGHGWEPDASVTRDIIEADAFVHVGEEFQPWADRAIRTVEDDDADTALVNVREGIDLIDIHASVGDDEAVGGGKDPHFWLDPERAKQSVENITEAFVDLHPDSESRLRENADAFAGVLDDINAEYQAIFDAADRRVVQLAAHNAFQYIGVRYDVEMHPLVFNLAASDDVKPTDMTRAKELVEENDIRYIGAAVFESRRPAEQILAETPVEAYFPVTPFAGVRKEWVEQEWGYTDIARKINMPTFEVVLGNKTPEEADHEDWRNFE
ncbi:metal ABC transporter substrate-binding protein [Halorussus amylolyticus]|uniref:metal ABC transporter substrate-binding protein n=1 Tax=Halorussus amylolyticus TaxID=1126242 RepID=UPI00104BF3EF|nr:metal ABC transporter substrate-binding protein [Halorussus amylolyticus]